MLGSDPTINNSYLDDGISANDIFQKDITPDSKSRFSPSPTLKYSVGEENKDKDSLKQRAFNKTVARTNDRPITPSRGGN